MSNYQLPNMLRSAYSNRENTSLLNKYLSESYPEIKLLFFKHIPEEYSRSDFVSSLMKTLIEEFQKGTREFWESVAEQNDINDKRIISYLFKIYSNHIYKKNLNKDEINLKNAIEESCKYFEKQKTIIKIGNHYTLNNNAKTKIKCNNRDIFIKSRCLSKGDISIDREKVKDFILFIFTELENNTFSISDLLEIIIANSDRGRIETVRAEDIGGEDGLPFDEVYNSNPDTYVMSGVENMDAIEILWNELQSIYQADSLMTYAVIFTSKFYLNLTYEEIQILLNNRIKKSSIDNYYKKFCNLIYTFLSKNDIELGGNLLPEFAEFLYIKYSDKLSKVDCYDK